MNKLKGGSNQWISNSTEKFLFAALIVIILSPLFLFEYFPNWDGPAHVGGAAIVAQYDNPARSAFRQYFFINTRPSPNLIGHIILIFLQVFVSPVWSEKLLVVLIFVSLPIAFRYLINTLNGRAKHLTYFVFPLTIGWFVYAGQYNFSLSLSIFFLTLSYCLQNRGGMNFGKIAVLSILLGILYFSHIVSYAMFFLFVCILVAHRNAVRLGDGDLTLPGSLWETVRDLLPVLVASLPSAIMAVIYFSSGNFIGFGNRQPVFDLIKAFGTLNSVLIVFTKSEYFFSILVSVTVLALCLIAVRVNRSRILKLSHVGFLFVFAFVLALYFLLPDALAGGSFLSPRLCLFAYIAIICWLAQFDFKPFVQRMFAVSLILAALGLTISRLPKIAAFNRDISEFLSAAPYLRKNATVLPLFYIYDGYHILEEDQNGVAAFARRTRPMDFITGYLMAEVGVVDLAHYESGYDYFPTQYRAELSPLKFLGTTLYWMESLPPAVNIADYYRMTPGQVDFVLVWGLSLATEKTLSDANTLLIQEQLAENYELIYTSEPRGLLQVYERNEEEIP